MSAEVQGVPLRTVAPATPRSTLRSVAVPTEHGGWSLTLEPAVLGLLVAWSWPGLALGAAALLAFVARTPLKVVLVDRWRGRRLPRTSIAVRVAVIELAAVAALVAAATWWGDRRFWWAVLAAAPLVVLELWFDMRSRSRRLLPELAGTVGIGVTAAAVALVAGAEAGASLGLWVVVAARGVAAVPYARIQVQRAHGRPHRRWSSDAAQIVALAAVAAAWAAGIVPPAVVVAIALVATSNLALVRAAPRPAKVIGIQQAVCGLAVVVVTAVASTA